MNKKYYVVGTFLFCFLSSLFCSAEVVLTKTAKDPAIIAVAGKSYSASLKGAKDAILINGPKGMTVTPAGTISWIPSHEDAPYVDVEIKVAAKTNLKYKIHVIGIPKAVQLNIKRLNKKFTGTDYSFAGIGDSITYSGTEEGKGGCDDTGEALWVINMAQSDKQPVKNPWNVQSGYIFIDRGFAHSSGCGWRSSTPLGTSWGGRTAKPSILEAALTQDKPEVASIMYGTNDGGGDMPPDEYRKNMIEIIDTVMKHHTIPILVVPSRNGWLKDRKNKEGGIKDMTPYINICKELAVEKKIPLLDLDMLYENEGTLNMFWAKGNPHPNSDYFIHKSGSVEERIDHIDRKTGYGVVNMGLYYMYRHLIDLDIIAAPAN